MSILQHFGHFNTLPTQVANADLHFIGSQRTRDSYLQFLERHPKSDHLATTGGLLGETQSGMADHPSGVVLLDDRDGQQIYL